MKDNRDKIKTEFKYYLANVVRSARRTREGFNLGRTAVDSFLSFIEVDRLFDYAPQKWSHIKSMYDIITPSEVKQIADDLLNDKAFLEHDNVKNQGWRSGAISHYVCFINARSFFLKEQEESNTSYHSDYSLQQIYYGAPGTGKSHEIKELTDGKLVIRTTFHPDSDYSTFVGAYKPTTIEMPMRDVTGKVIVENGDPVTENRIVYEFVEQAFLQAYTKAWKRYASATAEGKEPEEVYLIIEEINRGNCAQIFGDLFQLLDRGDNGFSEYSIVADKDLQKQLAKAFADMAFLNAPAVCGMSAEKVALKIRNGEILLLPNNLYIWATMNTSDQSLFPIDSAFKRRWDWQYIPISDGRKGWAIEANGKQYDWWEFLQKMNDKIGSATNSEDKKLGYYFCKAKDDIINAETFVGKVIFYIWNDVFKDFAEDAGDLFKDTDGTLLSFNKFYAIGEDGKTRVVEEKVELFLQNLGIKIIDGREEIIETLMDEDGNDTNAASNRNFDYTKYSVNGLGAYPKGVVAQQAIKQYVAMNPNKTADEVVRAWLGLNVKIPNLIETEQMFNARTSGSSDRGLRSRYKTVDLQNGEILYVSNQYNVERITDFMKRVNAQSWGIHIDIVNE